VIPDSLRVVIIIVIIMIAVLFRDRRDGAEQSMRFVIDTGSNAALIVSPNDGTRGQLAQSFPRTLVALSRGVGGEVRNRIGRGESEMGRSLRPRPSYSDRATVPEPRIEAPMATAKSMISAWRCMLSLATASSRINLTTPNLECFPKITSNSASGKPGFPLSST